MRIRNKLLLIFLLISLLPLLLISFFSITSSQARLKNTIGTNFAHLAKERAQTIALILRERISEAEHLATMPDVKDAVLKSNLAYINQPDPEIQDRIDQIDKEWIDAKGATETADQILNHPFSLFLIEYKDKNPARYGEIFVTDARGATVAMTKTLTDYYQADEAWWEQSYDQGRGKVFIDSRGYDQSVDTLVLGIVVPIKNKGEVVGILKINYKIREILDVASVVPGGKTAESFIVNSQGHYVAYTGERDRKALTEKEKTIVDNMESGWVEDVHDGHKTVMAYSPVRSEIFTRIPTPGARKGISGERWVPSKWHIFLEIEQDEAFIPIQKSRNVYLSIAAFVAIAVSSLAFVLARLSSRALEKLSKGAEAIGRGDLGYQVDIKTKDETGRLAAAFNQMSEALKTTTVSRDALAREITTRKEAEEAAHESGERYHAIFRQTTNSIFLVDPRNGAIVEFNDQAHENLGYTREEFKKLKVFDLSTDWSPKEARKHIEKIAQEGTASFDSKDRKKNGEIRDISVSAKMITIRGKAFILYVREDITHRKWAEKEQQLAASVFNTASEAITITDADANILSVNPAFTLITGYSAEEVIGQNPRILQSGRHDQAFYKTMWDKINTTGHWQGEIWNKRKGGKIYPEWLSITEVKDRQGRVVQYIGLFSDITERKQAEDKIESLAYYDQLTGLPNRILLFERLEETILSGKHQNRLVALLLLNLDRFREVNDALGHRLGDLILQEVGLRLKRVLHPEDMVARLGGDEFAIILPLSKPGDVRLVASKAVDILEKEPFDLEGLPVAIEASLGIALYPYHGSNSHSLIQRADAAMNQAKQGSGGFVIYQPEEDQFKAERLALMGELRGAIDANQLVLHYQPKLEAQTGEIIGVEALVRWNHPEQGMVPPDRFILPAEKSGLIRPLTGWVLNEALRQHQAWRQTGREVKIAVNVSARNLQDRNFYDQVLDLLQIYNTEPEYLEIEITESVIMTDLEHATEVITRLAKRGLRLSIDDFGTGYTSMVALTQLPVNTLKIDKLFVMGMITEEKMMTVVRSIIDLAHTLNLNVIAEGVENQETWDRLTSLGCDAVQGYYITRPLPAAEFITWLGSDGPSL